MLSVVVMSVVAPGEQREPSAYDQPTKDRADGALPLLWTPEELTHSPGIAYFNLQVTRHRQHRLCTSSSRRTISDPKSGPIVAECSLIF